MSISNKEFIYSLSKLLTDERWKSLRGLLRDATKIAETVPPSNSIKRWTVENGPLSFDYFHHNHFLPNLPLIVDVQCLENGEELMRLKSEWTLNGSFNIDHFIKTYGHFEAPVYSCENGRTMQNECGQERSVMKVESYLKSVMERNERESNGSLYLKDWHLVEQLRTPLYKPPLIFSHDYWNDWLDSQEKSDYRFVYIGDAQTWTPFHHDVLCSYSWSFNISGSKRWYLYDPSQIEWFKGRFSFEEAPYSIHDVDSEKFPNFHKTTPTIVTQSPGEVIFVPSRWFHQVENISEDTSNSSCLDSNLIVSINHNWINAHCIEESARYVLNSHRDAKQSIDDCRPSADQAERYTDWLQASHRLVAANIGMDATRLWSVIDFSMRKEMDLVRSAELSSILDAQQQGECRRALVALIRLFNTLDPLYFFFEEESAQKYADEVCLLKDEAFAFIDSHIRTHLTPASSEIFI